MTLYAADVSKYQVQVTNAYTRQWLIIRCCDGNTGDVNAVGNADWCRGAVAQGKMLGWTAYVVYRPGLNAAVLAHLTALGPLDCVMIDIESWSGAIRGDHSTEINALADGIVNLGVPANRVWGYGNVGDLGSIAPRRYSWLQVVVAAYGGTKPNVPNMIGWQYTNGQISSGSRPTSSAPFGACDHNELYVDSTQLLSDVTQIETGGTVTEFSSAQVNSVVAAADLINYLQGQGQFAGPYQNDSDTRTRIGQIQYALTQIQTVDADTNARVASVQAALAALTPGAAVPTAVDVTPQLAALAAQLTALQTDLAAQPVAIGKAVVDALRNAGITLTIGAS